jgi:hypothetical protein
VKTGLGDNVNLDGRVAAGIVDRPGVDLGDRHVVLISEGGQLSVNV